MTEGSRWLGRRQCRHDAGSKIDLKSLCESCFCSSVRLETSAEYRSIGIHIMTCRLLNSTNNMYPLHSTDSREKTFKTSKSHVLTLLLTFAVCIALFLV